MKPLFSRGEFGRRLSEIVHDPAALRSSLAEAPLPAPLGQWLTRLMLLYGVPINYLVPDEAMLPPESIRFFYVDMNWVDALIDGAFSIGRTVAAGADTASHAIDRAVHPTLQKAVRQRATSIRAQAFGVDAPPPALQVMTGFLLRSKLVMQFPGLGVNAYPAGGRPTDPTVSMLNILRLEQLGAQSDTIICLVDGEAVQFDVHEPPEGLHYGLEIAPGPPPVRLKTIRPFTRAEDQASIDLQSDPIPVPTDGPGSHSPTNFDPQCFRPGATRTLMMQAVAGAMGQAIVDAVGAPASGLDPTNPTLDSAEMGFEMTEGVGMVSFVRADQQS